MIRGVNLLDRIEAGFDRGVAAIRRRSARFDHLWRAGERFVDVLERAPVEQFDAVGALRAAETPPAALRLVVDTGHGVDAGRPRGKGPQAGAGVLECADAPVVERGDRSGGGRWQQQSRHPTPLLSTGTQRFA